MAVPVVVGDIGGPYIAPPPAPPLMATVVTGSTRVFIKGKPVALFGRTATTLGPIITSTMNSTVTMIEGSPVILGGSLTNLGSGYSNGQLFALGAIGVNVS